MPSADQILDLVTAAQPHFVKDKYTQLATSLQRYHIMGQALRKDKRQISDGTSIQKRVMYRDAGTARMTSLFATRPFFRQDKLSYINIPWRHTIWSYFWDVREGLMNRSNAQIIDHIKAERGAAYISAAELLETQGFGKPTDSSDTDNVYGFTYWLTRATSTTANRFTGLAPAGFSDKGGLSPTTYDRWRNWSATYQAINDQDFIYKAKECMIDTDWESPSGDSQDDSGKGAINQVLVGKELLLDCESYAKKSNDQVGTDLTYGHGKVRIMGNPLTYTPFLNSDSAKPAYFLNRDTFHAVVLKGDYLQESAPKDLPDRPRTQGVDITLTWNMYCDDLRKNGVLYYSA